MAHKEKKYSIRASRTTIYDMDDDVLRETFAHLKLGELSVMPQEKKRIPIRAPQTTMYDLNDDVLRETFAHLKVKELNVMADVCSTFRRVAQQEFASRHRKVEYASFNKIDECRIFNEVCIGDGYWVSFLQKFGNVTTSISTTTSIHPYDSDYHINHY